MPALASQIIDMIAAGLTTLYPTTPIKKRRGSSKNPIYTNGDPTPMFAVSCNDGIEIQGGTATKAICEYEATVSYITREIPGQRDVDPAAVAVMGVQEAVRKKFDVTSIDAVPAISQCDPKVLKPFDQPFDDKLADCSAVLLRIETFEPRN